MRRKIKRIKNNNKKRRKDIRRNLKERWEKENEEETWEQKTSE